MSETIEAITSGKIDNAFESFDITLTGRFNFPEVNAVLFSYSVMFPPAAPISVLFGNYLSISVQTIEKMSHNMMCTKERLKSACACALSDQKLRLPHEETLHPVKSLIRLPECASYS